MRSLDTSLGILKKFHTLRASVKTSTEAKGLSVCWSGEFQWVLTQSSQEQVRPKIRPCKTRRIANNPRATLQTLQAKSFYVFFTGLHRGLKCSSPSLAACKSTQMPHLKCVYTLVLLWVSISVTAPDVGLTMLLGLMLGLSIAMVTQFSRMKKKITWSNTLWDIKRWQNLRNLKKTRHINYSRQSRLRTKQTQLRSEKHEAWNVPRIPLRT